MRASNSILSIFTDESHKRAIIIADVNVIIFYYYAFSSGIATFRNDNISLKKLMLKRFHDSKPLSLCLSF